MSKDQLVKDNGFDKGNGFEGAMFPDLRVLYPHELEMLSASAELLTFNANDPIIVEGQTGDSLYLVKSGQLRVNKRHEDDVSEVGAINPGDMFGEASVLYQSTAGAEVRAVDNCEVYVIPASVVQDVFKTNDRFLRATTQLAENRAAASALAVNPVFSTLPLAVREVALYNAKFVTVKQGEVIIHAGDPAVYMFVILAGQVDISIPHPTHLGEHITVATLSSGDDIGDVAVVTGYAHSATVRAKTAVRVLAIRNISIEAWACRYSDFAYSLYAQVSSELKENRMRLNEFIDDREARNLTTNQIPSLEEYKIKYNL